MSLYELITSDMKEAMINKDKEKLSTLRLLKSSIDLFKINNKLEEVTNELVIDVVSKQIKTHKESIVEFEKANRQDLIDKANFEINILLKYLPEQLSEDEIIHEIDLIFNEIKPTGKQDLGKIMKAVSSKLKGKADMKFVSSIVNSKIN